MEPILTRIQPETSLKDVRVLVVEDSEDIQLLISYFLKRNGAIVSLAKNGIEGVHMALSENYDVVLMDIQMPKMDGFEAMAALREHGFHTAVIALTAHAMEDEKRMTKAAGFSGHIAKPIDRQALINAIARLSNKQVA